MLARRLALLLIVAALGAADGRSQEPAPAPRAAVSRPPQALNLDPFYKKYVEARGIPVVSSGKVPDEALVRAAEVVRSMLARRPDLARALAGGKVRVAVMGKGEVTTDIPEHRSLKPKERWDRRARGLGGTPHIPTTSCAEENVLGYPDDRYSGESILVHEFAHTVHEVGMRALDRGFDDRLRRLFARASDRGLWKRTYAAVDHKEYWAEGVQAYFDSNRRANPPDGNHNHVRTREELKSYDADLAALIEEVFAANPWRWTPDGAHARRWAGRE